jgi:GTPase SAR1 family protein
MLVYDITDRQTFQDIDNWLNEALHNGGKEITRMLVGT